MDVLQMCLSPGNHSIMRQVTRLDIWHLEFERKKKEVKRSEEEMFGRGYQPAEEETEIRPRPMLLSGKRSWWECSNFDNFVYGGHLHICFFFTTVVVRGPFMHLLTTRSSWIQTLGGKHDPSTSGGSDVCFWWRLGVAELHRTFHSLPS